MVLILLAFLLGFHLLSVFGGSALRVELIVALGLFPARFFSEGLGGLPGGWVQGVVNLFSHSLLHGSWTHLILNGVWLLAFGLRRAGRCALALAVPLGSSMSSLHCAAATSSVGSTRSH